MALTDLTLKQAKPREKLFRLHDSSGLYIEIVPSGGKWWRYKYRIGGKDKRISLGVYPEVGLKEARTKRDAARDLVKGGIDPSAARKAGKVPDSADGVEIVAREWWAKFSPTWASGKYRAITLRRLELNVFPWIGKRPVAEIDAPEMLAVIKRIEDRGANDTAHRILGLISQVFRYAIATGRAKHNPASEIGDALAPRQVEHFAATTEPKRLAEILRAMDGYHGSLAVRCALRQSGATTKCPSPSPKNNPLG